MIMNTYVKKHVNTVNTQIVFTLAVIPNTDPKVMPEIKPVILTCT